jgi:polyhydroxybutyrate depolymerase
MQLARSGVTRSARASTSKAALRAWILAAGSMLAGAAGAGAGARDDAAGSSASMTGTQSGVARGLPEKGRLASARRRTLAFGGLSRSYLVQSVPAARGPGPYPVVVLLHGGTQTSEEVWRQTSLPTLGEREDFIVVAPQGVDRHWNDARGSTIAGDPASTADDVGFLKAVIADVAARDHGDVSAVFMVGVSNGGFMTMRFACDAGDVLRAASSVIATLPEPMKQSCRSPRPLPWLAINGTDDPLIPFGGQPEGATRRGNPQPALLSANDTFRFWADRDGCAPGVTRRTLTDASQDERRRWAESFERSGCAGGQVSRQVVMHGSGHVFPGLPIRLALVEHVVGAPAPELDGGTLVWQFFRATLMK